MRSEITLLLPTFILGCSLLAGCGGSGGSGSGQVSTSGGSSSGGAQEVEVAAFQGGYGIDFFQQAAKEYEAKHPKVKLRVWGNPRIWEQLRPRFIAGTPPDLTWPGWGMDYWPLVYDGQVAPLDAALDGPPYDGKGTWRDTFDPYMLKLGQYKGKQYMLPYFFNMQGWWYNPKLFAQHGWTPPHTYSELLALCAKIKSAGIAPITYQGKYPDYTITGFLFPWVVSAGGIKALDDAQNLVPGAWKSPAFLQAARMIKDLKDRGYFQDQANSMSHTESQMEFVEGRAAMIPCGTWLHSEMSKVMPPGFEMAYFLPPHLDKGIGDPGAVGIGIEPWIVPSKSKHQAVAIDFYRYLTSLPKAKQFVQEKGTLMAIRGSDKTTIPPYLQGAAAAYRASHTIWSSEYTQWYPPMAIESRNAMSALLAGDITPEQFVDRLEAVAQKARSDKSLPRHQISRV